MVLTSRRELELPPLVPESTVAAGHTGGVREMELATVFSLARAIEARDPFTGSHLERVRRYSIEIARVLTLSDADVWRISVGAVLHDVGKIGVPDAVLNKRGPLTPQETEEMRRHPTIGARLIGDNPALEPARASILTHHERWDGSGYPQGLARHDIPLDGRIVAVADAFDAMTADRPYRFGFRYELALAELAAGSGTQFDPDIVRAFWSIPMIQDLARGHEPRPAAEVAGEPRLARLSPAAA